MDDSINLLIVAEEAKENKLRLFTDLSHEFRTVVTLITNPIHDILSITNDESIKSKLKVLQRSAERLARLTDSILKFRRIDENQYHGEVLKSLFFIKTKYLIIVNLFRDKIDYNLLLKTIAEKGEIIKIAYEPSESGEECIGFAIKFNN